MREDELREQLRRQSMQFREELENEVRLNGELRRQSVQSEETIRKLHAEIEHFKITRFEAKRECHSIKTSLSWRITWPLRLVRDRLASAVWRARRAFSKRSAKAAVTPKDSQRSIIASLFDEEYYTKLNPEATASGRSPIEHYLEKGWKEGLKPHPLFDPTWYLRENPDVAKAGAEPLYHYITGGWREGRSPHPLFDVRYYLNQAPQLCRDGH